MSIPFPTRSVAAGALGAVLTLLAPPVSAQSGGLQNPLLDHLIGDWVLTGVIAGDSVTHDVVFEWVLERQYVQMYELARERDAAGRPAYEAIVFIGWDEPTQRYACLWLDSTGGGGLTGEGIGYAVPGGDSLPFFFRFPDGSPFHTTFAYRRGTDTWVWTMDGENDDGTPRPFARVTLTRK